MRHSILLSLALVIVLALSACNLNTRPAAAPQAWIDAPLDGMVLPLAPYQLVAHASDAGGISQIEFAVNGQVIGSVAGSGPLFSAQQSWSPSAPGQYVIRARGMGSGGAWSQYAEVRVVVQGQVTETPAATAAGPSETPSATPSPTETLTATPSVVSFTLFMNANCRRGPSQVYDPLTSLLSGQTVPIVGENEDETWWLVRIPTKELCWISTVTGMPSGNTSAVPFVQPPPTPVEEGCTVYDANQNLVCKAPCPKHAVPGDACTP